MPIRRRMCLFVLQIYSQLFIRNAGESSSPAAAISLIVYADALAAAAAANQLLQRKKSIKSV